MSLERLPNWPEQLILFFEQNRLRPFAWGSNDCALFYADAIVVMTGVDVAAHLRGYTTAEEAARIVAKYGGMKALALSCGLKEKPVGFAQRGDGVLADVEERETFGVVSGDGYWRGPGTDGLLFRPMSEALAAFEI